MNNTNDPVRDVWDQLAEFWDCAMGDGNDFFRIVVWPAVERLLGPVQGQRVLDLACGNGLTARILAAQGASVVACDLAPKMIEAARRRPSAGAIDYRTLDLTASSELAQLENAGGFDAVLCNMAVMDMATLDPMMAAVPGLLSGSGRFVVSGLHPCFNNPWIQQVGELEDRDGAIEITHYVKVRRYLTAERARGRGMPDQPLAHTYFHRSLQELLRPALLAGLVLDGLEEPAFPRDHQSGNCALSWSGRFSEIPPVLVIRLRCVAG